MKFVLASNNKKKLSEMCYILSKLNIDIMSQEELGIAVDPEETGSTFEENAFIKAEAVMKAAGIPAIADDSGLVVDALDGAPGIYSARFGGANNNDEDRYKLLLTKMNDMEQRSAKFVSYIVCVFPNGDKITAAGECEGEIARVPRGTGGFGYDPVFFLRQYGKTMAELEPHLKNKISHRALAIEAFKNKLVEYMDNLK